MNNIQLDNIQTLEKEVLNNTELEVLKINNSSVNLPSAVGKMLNLKELHLTNNTLEQLPIELLNLEKTFIFCDNNKPESIQLSAVVIFDLQKKNINKAEAEVFFKLLQKDTKDISANELPILIKALDYRIKEVQDEAIAVLSSVLPAVAEIKEKAVVTVLGTPERFSIKDIKHRMQNVSVGIQNKLTPKTTHIVLCALHKNATKDLDLSKFTFLSESMFSTWLDNADKQLLASGNDENSEALANVSAMLLGDDPEHNEMALTMMKTHGVSAELLTDLYIFFNKTNNDKLKRRAKALFKKQAPKELLTYFDDNQDSYYGKMEGFKHRDTFYKFLKENPLLDRFKIALVFNNRIYLTLAEGEKKMVSFIKNLMPNGVLEIKWEVTPEIKEAILEIKQFPSIVFKSIRHDHNHDWIASLEVENVDFYELNLDISEYFAKMKSLKSICLSHYYSEFPHVITENENIEFIELQQSQFVDINEDIKKMKNLKTILMHPVSMFKDPISEDLMEEKKKLLPEGCELKKAESGRRRY